MLTPEVHDGAPDREVKDGVRQQAHQRDAKVHLVVTRQRGLPQVGPLEADGLLLVAGQVKGAAAEGRGHEDVLEEKPNIVEIVQLLQL